MRKRSDCEMRNDDCGMNGKRPDGSKGERRDSSDDLAILQEILWLRGGQLDNFHPIQPPAAVIRFLRTATLGQLQGTLVEVLAMMRDGGNR